MGLGSCMLLATASSAFMSAVAHLATVAPSREWNTQNGEVRPPVFFLHRGRRMLIQPDCGLKICSRSHISVKVRQFSFGDSFYTRAEVTSSIAIFAFLRKPLYVAGSNIEQQ